LLANPEEADEQLRRIWWDNILGMGASNLIAFFIILTTAVALHAHGVTNIQTTEQAAAALKPVAGPFAFLLFSLGIVGTGLLAVPVLAGSGAYAVGELRGWKIGLESKPAEAIGFYGVIGAAVLFGLVLTWSDIDPIKPLFWSAVINGAIAVPIMAATMVVGARRQQMGPFVATRMQLLLGWLAAAVMAAAVVTMFVTM